MKILVIGNGGREHALVWKIAQSKRVKKIFAAPGNPGISQLAELIDLKTDDVLGLAEFAEKEKIDLTIVGPEIPLVLGIVDEFELRGLKIFGPSKLAAQIEGSKVFSKNLLKKYHIPTAEYSVFDSADQAKEYLIDKDFPLVIKVDGPVAGKGVVICYALEHAHRIIDSILSQKSFGEAGNKIIIEEFLKGEEVSFLAFSDGKNLIPLASSQDHKALYDDDKGPNTGGMGAYSPVPIITDALNQEIMDTIMYPAIQAMANEGIPYKGILYAGLMIDNGKLKVLEFNARFGDPETQVLLMRMESDLVPVLEAAINGKLSEISLVWKPEPSVCVIMAQKGYPADYEKGEPIQGLEDFSATSSEMIFHAGTAIKTGKVVTNGGRVIGVTAIGKTLPDAIIRAYNLTARINWKGAYFRRDIGKKGIKH